MLSLCAFEVYGGVRGVVPRFRSHGWQCCVRRRSERQSGYVAGSSSAVMRLVINAAVVLGLVVSVAHACIQALDGWKDVGLEERAKRAPVVFHGLAIETIEDVANADLYAVQFWMINIYKGAEDIANLLKLDPGSGGVFNLRDR